MTANQNTRTLEHPLKRPKTQEGITNSPNMKLLVFTGTGNSLYVAKQFQQAFDGEILAIPKLLRDGQFLIEADIIGIISPIYGLQLPNLVDRYLQQATIKSSYTFTILTYALFTFSAKSLLNQYSFPVQYTREIKMENNFLPWFDMAKNHNRNLSYKDNIPQMVQHVTMRRVHNCGSRVKRFIGNQVSRVTREDYPNMDRIFYVTDECTLCGMCERVCPVDNIVVQDKVQFRHNCEYCLACIHICPTKALRHKKERSDSRYRHEAISTQELVQLNRG